MEPKWTPKAWLMKQCERPLMLSTAVAVLTSAWRTDSSLWFLGGVPRPVQLPSSNSFWLVAPIKLLPNSNVVILILQTLLLLSVILRAQHEFRHVFCSSLEILACAA